MHAFMTWHCEPSCMQMPPSLLTVATWPGSATGDDDVAGLLIMAHNACGAKSTITPSAHMQNRTTMSASLITPQKSCWWCAFQELVGVVVDLVWDKDTGSLHVLAACNLPAGMPLTSGLTAVGADPEHLIMTDGPEMLPWMQQTTQGQGHVLLPWQAPDAASFQLCIEPAEEDEVRDSKMELLVASALGTTHALTATSSQVRQPGSASHVTLPLASPQKQCMLPPLAASTVAVTGLVCDLPGVIGAHKV